jgi:osmotically-inducible protein OsmY
MNKFTAGLLVGIVLGGGGLWAFENAFGERDKQLATQTLEQGVARVGDAVADAAHDMKVAAEAKLAVLELAARDIKAELEESGRVVRLKARQARQTMADTAADVLVTAKIEAKYAADDELSAMRISVDTTNGRVTLSGTVASLDLIGKAMVLALETEGALEVVSTLQVE